MALGCGGCDWQHLTEDEQVARKVATVQGSLERLGGVVVPEIQVRPLPQPFGYRTQLRMGVEAGQAAFRAGEADQDLHTDHRMPGRSSALQRDDRRTGPWSC